MKLSATPILWILFFLFVLFFFNKVAQQYVEPREIIVSDELALSIGEKIWKNEGDSKFSNLIVWHEGEKFASLGLGHFIWYPANSEHTFQESFPDMLQYIAQTREIPTWLQQEKASPWHSREDFLKKTNNDFSRKLRRFLQDTMAEQTQFIILRMEASLPKILKTIKNGFMREAVRTNFYHVANQTNGVYALVDYVNFKGEGISAKEKYNNQGWGLLQVLQHMDKNEINIMKAFVDSANQRLTRRVVNAPNDERKWLPLWLKRIQTYQAS